MKHLAFLIALSFTITVTAQSEGNYIAIINGDSVQISLNKQFTYKTPQGENLTFEIVQPGNSIIL